MKRSTVFDENVKWEDLPQLEGIRDGFNENHMCGERKITIIRLPPTPVVNFRGEENSPLPRYVTMCPVHMLRLPLSSSVLILFNPYIKGAAAVWGLLSPC